VTQETVQNTDGPNDMPPGVQSQDFSFIFKGKAKTKEELAKQNEKQGEKGKGPVIYRIEEKALMFFTVIFIILVICVLYLAYKLYFQTPPPQTPVQTILTRQGKGRANAQHRNLARNAERGEQPGEHEAEQHEDNQQARRRQEPPAAKENDAAKEEKKETPHMNKTDLEDARNILAALNALQPDASPPNNTSSATIELEPTNETTV
jgi:type IV secretory pathway VirB10-like protein